MRKWWLWLIILVIIGSHIYQYIVDRPSKQSNTSSNISQDFANSMAKGNSRIASFTESKTLLRKIYKQYAHDYYCDCAYEYNKVNYKHCSYDIQGDLDRAMRIEWDHVIPASWFGRHFREWSQGDIRCMKHNIPYKGRQCAQAINKQYQYMEADMYNLIPAIGEINKLREDYSFAEIWGEKRQYGNCNLEIANGQIEIRDEMKGNIARISLYMNWAYPDHHLLSHKQYQLMLKWNAEDPVDQREYMLAQQISRIQGNNNPYIDL